MISNNLVTADAGSDFSVCSPWATLSGNNPSPGTGVWTIQVGGGVTEDENSPTSEITNLSLHDNIIRWTITNNTCVNYDQVTITNNTVTATAGGDQALCYNHTFLSGQEPDAGGIGLWEVILGNGTFQDASLYNTEVTNLASGFNTFRWTVFNNGCNSGGDEITINNRKDENIVVDVERALGLNWKILSSSIDFKKLNSQNILFKVPVKPAQH